MCIKELVFIGNSRDRRVVRVAYLALFQKDDPHDDHVDGVADAGVEVQWRYHVHDGEEVGFDVAVAVEGRHRGVGHQQSLHMALLGRGPSPAVSTRLWTATAEVLLLPGLRSQFWKSRWCQLCNISQHYALRSTSQLLIFEIIEQVERSALSVTSRIIENYINTYSLLAIYKYFTFQNI